MSEIANRLKHESTKVWLTLSEFNYQKTNFTPLKISIRTAD